MDVSQTTRFHVVIHLSDATRWIAPCLAAIQAQSLPPAKITVFDNGSTDDRPERVGRDFPQVRLIRNPDNLGFAGGNNRAIAHVRDAEFVMILSPEAIPALNCLERLGAAFNAQPDIGILGCKVLASDIDTIHHVGVALRGNGLPRHLGRGEIDSGQYYGLRDAPGVLGSALAVRTEVWCELGGFDERFFPAHYETIDFCLRARSAGWRVSVACDAAITYFGDPQVLDGDADYINAFFRSRARFLLKHYRKRDWLLRYLPDEIRWLCRNGSGNLRTTALRALWRAWRKDGRLF